MSLNSINILVNELKYFALILSDSVIQKDSNQKCSFNFVLIVNLFIESRQSRFCYRNPVVKMQNKFHQIASLSNS